MKTTTYQVRIIEKDGLPKKDGWYNCGYNHSQIFGDRFYFSVEAQRFHRYEIHTQVTLMPFHYLEPIDQSLPKSIEWLDIKSHPKKNSEWFIGLTKDDEIVKAHYACNLSGEEQPPFEGFFKKLGSDSNTEVELKAWIPMPDSLNS